MASVFHTLLRKHLFAVNISVSVGLSALGDFIQQKNQMNQQRTTISTAAKTMPGSQLNLKRTCQMSVSFGLTSGFLCHFWYNFLDIFFPGKGIKIVLKKIVSDQVLFSPICIVSCLLVASVLDGHSKRRAYQETVVKGTQLYIAEWMIWPPAQFVNFYFLPTRYRVLYDNFVSLGYDVYTSHVKHLPCCD